MSAHLASAYRWMARSDLIGFASHQRCGRQDFRQMVGSEEYPLSICRSPTGDDRSTKGPADRNCEGSRIDGKPREEYPTGAAGWINPGLGVAGSKWTRYSPARSFAGIDSQHIHQIMLKRLGEVRNRSPVIIPLEVGVFAARLVQPILYVFQGTAARGLKCILTSAP